MTIATTAIEPEFHVRKTYDYSLFSPLDGNRSVNQAHIGRLLESFKNNPLVTFILVNEYLQIIDGQHRFEVLKHLGQPVYYVIVPGYGLDEVHILNANQKKWSLDDYLEAYCRKQLPSYLAYRDFRNEFGLNHAETRVLLSPASWPKTHYLFLSGKFEISDLELAYSYGNRLRFTGNYYSGWRRRSYILAMLRLFNKEQFDFARFIDKLKLQPTVLKDCASTGQYLELIEQIYNYRCSEKNRVNLRY